MIKVINKLLIAFILYAVRRVVKTYGSGAYTCGFPFPPEIIQGPDSGLIYVKSLDKSCQLV